MKKQFVIVPMMVAALTLPSYVAFGETTRAVKDEVNIELPEINTTTEVSQQEVAASPLEDTDSKTPRFSIAKDLGYGIDIKDRIVYIYTECRSWEKADISMKAELQRKDNGNWKTIKTYKNSAKNTTSCDINESYAVTMGEIYRIKVTATLDNGSTTEEIVKYSSTQECYSLMEP